jgi:hypothetical protein
MLKQPFLIFEKKNSLPNSLCDEIINNYENDLINRNFVVDNCSYNINYDEKYKRILKTLNNELNSSIDKYFDLFKNETLINKKSNFNCDYHLTDRVEKSEIIPSKNNIFFIIKKTEYNNNSQNITIYKKNESQNNNGIKMFMFIWVLNDCDGEFLFWNKVKVDNKKGTLLIFPTSFLYQYSELMKNETSKYAIHGFIFKKKSHMIKFTPAKK